MGLFLFLSYHEAAGALKDLISERTASRALYSDLLARVGEGLKSRVLRDEE
jgi:hypothetical protein